MATGDPDFKALRAIVERTKAAHRDGTLTRARFKELVEEAKKAVNGHEEFLESLLLYAPR